MAQPLATPVFDPQPFKSCAEDAALLARLHDRELEEQDVAALAAAPARDWLWLNLHGADAGEGRRLIDEWLAAAQGAPALDGLAADYADIYLTFGKRVSPTESYWLTEDHLERQAPMFEVRHWLDHYGLTAADWRKRADDHLVTELLFLARLLEEASPDTLGDAAHFLDTHLLRWSAAFCAGVAAHAETGFYAGLALLTEAWLQALRDELQRTMGLPRAQPAAAEGLRQAPAETPFVPGAAPGW
jgi:TorA maturation chaperone TorD